MPFLLKKDFVQLAKNWRTSIISCLRYNNLRVSLIPNYYRIRPNMFKLIELLSSKSKTNQRNMSLYIFKAFKVREQYLLYTK